MKIEELIGRVNKKKPAVLKDIPEKKATALIRAVLGCVGDAIDEIDEGKVAIVTLGNFRVRQKEREVDGEKKVVKAIAFRRASPKKKSGDKT